MASERHKSSLLQEQALNVKWLVIHTCTCEQHQLGSVGYMYVYLYMCINMYISAYICVYVYMYTSICIYIYKEVMHSRSNRKNTEGTGCQRKNMEARNDKMTLHLCVKF